GHQGQARVAGEPHEATEISLLCPVEVALRLHEAVVTAEDPGQAIEDPPPALAVTARHGRRQRTAAAPGETHEPLGVGLEIVEPDAAGALGGAELEARDESAEVAIPVAVFDEHGQPRAVGERQLAADDRP